MTANADRPLDGRTSAVLHAETPAGMELAAGLGDLGATIADDPTREGAGSNPPIGKVDVDGPATVDDGGSVPDLVVVPVLPGDDGSSEPLAELGPDRWIDACERPLRVAKDDLVAGHAMLTGGGTIVVVGPVAAITGESGMAGYSAAAEGARAMALSCARAWGTDGITVHWVTVPTGLLAAGASTTRVTLWDEALGRPPTLRHDVAAVIAGLAAPTMRFLTGTSVTVDGGVVMHV